MQNKMRGYKDELCSSKVLPHIVRFFQSFRLSCPGVILFLICINNYPYALLIIHLLFSHIFIKIFHLFIRRECKDC